MVNIRTKLLLFFLINAFFLCISTGFAIIYTEKLSESTENTSNLKNALNDLTTHSEDFLKISNLYSAENSEKFDALESEFNFSISSFNRSLEILEKESSLNDNIKIIKNVGNQYTYLLNKISSDRKAYNQKNAEYAQTLASMKKIRYEIIDQLQNGHVETQLLVSRMGYYDKEFNFQYEDQIHANQWLSAIDKFKDYLKNSDEENLLEAVNSYAELAEIAIAEKNDLIDMNLNFGYYLEKLDNAFTENRIQNAKITQYIDAKLKNVQDNSRNFKVFSIAFIVFLLIFGSTFMAYYSRKLTNSIANLSDVSKKIMNGDLSVRTDIHSNDEIEYLSKTFNNMLDNISEKNDALKKESSQLKTLLSSISEGLLLVDKKYNIILANAAASKILRMKNIDLKGKNLKETIEMLHSMENVPVEKWPFEHVFRNSRSINLKLNDDYYIKTREGRIFPIEMAIGPIESEGTYGAVAVFRDTTEMKLIEEEREFSRKNLESVLKSIYIERDNVQEEKNKLEALLNSVGDAVLAIDEEKKIIVFNPIAEKITGLKMNDVEKEKFGNSIKFIEEESGKESSDFINKVLLNGEKIELNDLAIMNRKGKKVLIDINAAPIVNYKGKIMGCIIIFKDVTFKREAERMRTDFVSIVSHQLRTPLSAMKWFLEILLDGDVGRLKKEQREVVEEIHESNSSMINFVNQMLNVSRIESHHLAINIEKIKLCKTIGDLLKEVKPFFKEKKQKLSYSCLAEQDLEINTDRNLLRNVLSSVMLNASRYTPQKGNIELIVSRYDKDFVLFKVKDNGIGIPEEEKVKIFRKFSRASNAIRYEANGTGLGLYVVKSIINMVCGKIWFESEENKGTTFYFTLPIENMVCEIDDNDAKMLI